MQVRALGNFDGRELSSYLLDPEVNHVPELPLGGEDPVGPARAVLHRPPSTAGGALSW